MRLHAHERAPVRALKERSIWKTLVDQFTALMSPISFPPAEHDRSRDGDYHSAHALQQHNNRVHAPRSTMLKLWPDTAHDARLSR